VAEILAVTI